MRTTGLAGVRRGRRWIGTFVFGVVLLAVPAAPAFADLPLGYDVDRVNTPDPQPGGGFGIRAVNVGDVNGDGADDFASAQSGNGPNGDGEVFLVSGAAGTAIATIVAPDSGGAGGKASFGTWVDTLPDLASCSSSSGGECTATLGGPDGTPEILVGATGVDTAAGTDRGRVYVIDGADRVVLKRIDIPAADSQQGANFGRTAFAPLGQPPCGGKSGGVGSCVSVSVPSRVESGDLDGGGDPDIVIGAPGYDETSATNDSCPTTCDNAGRAYVYHGESLAGTDPSTVENTADRRLLNPDAQGDVASTTNYNSELYSQAVYPIGDVSSGCAAAAPGGTTPYVCSPGNSTVGQDGVPDFLVSAFRADDGVLQDVGYNYVIDGATGASVVRYEHPEPQRAAIFGFTVGASPAPGNLGDSPLPDVFIPAMRQNTSGFTAGGRGYVMNGNWKAGANSINFAQLNDPTPASNANFGVSFAGVGDLVSSLSSNEILVGSFGPHNPGTNQGVINDVTFFNAVRERALQTIGDPDAQPGSAFGASLAPLGDLNGDGFLDFVVGANLWNSSSTADQGRMYIFRSDNQALRSLTLKSNKAKVRKRRRVRLSGALRATGNESECVPGQHVTLERKRRRGFKSFASATTDASGAYSRRVKVRRTFRYRASVDETAACSAVQSNVIKVKAKRRRR